MTKIEDANAATEHPHGDRASASLDISVFRVRVRVLSPCGHPLNSARNVGTPNWQNKWECQECGYVWSR